MWLGSTPIILTYNDRDVMHLHMMMILSGAWPQATALPAGPGGRGRRPRPGNAPARPAAAKPAPAPAGPQGQAMACARYKDGSLAAEPLVLDNLQTSMEHTVFRTP